MLSEGLMFLNYMYLLFIKRFLNVLEYCLRLVLIIYNKCVGRLEL